MLGDCSRRRFIEGTAVATLTVLGARSLWSEARRHAPPAVPRWLPIGDLQSNIPRLLELAMVPGLAVGVIENGATWVRGFGRTRAAEGHSIDENTVFEAASLGKPLCAYAALRLVDAGKLQLDRPLYEYLPLVDGDNDRMRRVTLRHVLSHSTGLPNWRKEAGPLEPAADPGTSFSYSGEAFFYLQRVMESVTGMPFAHLMGDLVLSPLGMTNSSFVWRPEFADRMATGHDADGRPMEVMSAIGRRIQIIAEEWHRPLLDWRYQEAAKAVALVNPAWPELPLYMVPNAATSLLTTVEDYLRFLSLVVGHDATARVALSDEMSRAMMTPQIELNRELSWGLGWGLEQDGDQTLLWQWGANNAFRNFFIADPANGRAVVVFTNGENGPRVYERVITAITRSDHAAFLWV
jgi:CubicO group peptidase (beta-lactamase class C family)